MIRNSQRVKIKEAFRLAYSEKDDKQYYCLTKLKKALKEFNISPYVFREYLFQRNRKIDSSYTKEWIKEAIEMTINKMYPKLNQRDKNGDSLSI
ncbi:MAG: hypothetical protein ACK5KL_04270 [Dysgonomonas sp.]